MGWASQDTCAGALIDRVAELKGSWAGVVPGLPVHRALWSVEDGVEVCVSWASLCREYPGEVNGAVPGHGQGGA